MPHFTVSKSKRHRYPLPLCMQPVLPSRRGGNAPASADRALSARGCCGSTECPDPDQAPVLSAVGRAAGQAQQPGEEWNDARFSLLLTHLGLARL